MKGVATMGKDPQRLSLLKRELPRPKTGNELYLSLTQAHVSRQVEVDKGA
jgi:hypothetical protein